MSLRTSFGRRPTVLRLAAGLAVAGLLVTLVSANVLAAPTQKQFSVWGAGSTPPTVENRFPTSIGPGAVTFVVYNDPTSQQQLGSLEVQLTPGTGSTSVFTYGTSPQASINDSYATATYSFLDATTTPSTQYPTLLVQNLNLPSGGYASITIGNGLSGCGSLQWNFMAQQANQWNGSKSANIVNAVSQPTSTVLTACHLAFVKQPTDAGATQTITNSPLNPGGTPVTVQLQDANNSAVTGVSLAVSLAANTVLLDESTSGATLNGSGPATTSSSTGNATFAPSISPSLNTGYTSGGGTFTLTASATGVASVTSNQFRIWGNATTCSGTSCNESLSSGNGELFNVTSNLGSGNYLGGSVNIVNFDCSSGQYGGVPALPGTYVATWTAVGSTISGTKTTKIIIPDQILQDAINASLYPDSYQTNYLLETHYMVCMSAPHEFQVAWTPNLTGQTGQNPQAAEDPQMASIMDTSTDANGNPTPMWYRGLVPDCQDVSTLPCVQSRKYASGGLTITVLSAASDPMGR